MTEIVNLNTTKAEELTELPGIGPAMAERIIANRPYEALEDLLSVSGVGPALLERLAPLVSVAEVEEPQEDEEVIYLGPESDAPPESDQESLPAWDGSEQEIEEVPDTTSQLDVDQEEAPETEEDLPSEEETVLGEQPTMDEEPISKEKAIIPVAEEETTTEKPDKQPKPVTFGKALLLAVACSFVAFILAVLLSLGILGSLNNGLRYASSDQAQAIYSQLKAINSEIGSLNEDMDGLRARLDNLESLSGRVGELEMEAETLSTNMTTMAEEFQGIKDQISEITESAERFQVFLKGLGDLLDTLTEVPEEVP